VVTGDPARPATAGDDCGLLSIPALHIWVIGTLWIRTQQELAGGSMPI